MSFDFVSKFQHTSVARVTKKFFLQFTSYFMLIFYNNAWTSKIDNKRNISQNRYKKYLDKCIEDEKYCKPGPTGLEQKGARTFCPDSFFFDVRERIRTPDTLVRSQVLYPAELHTHTLFFSASIITLLSSA